MFLANTLSPKLCFPIAYDTPFHSDHCIFVEFSSDHVLNHQLCHYYLYFFNTDTSATLSVNSTLSNHVNKSSPVYSLSNSSPKSLNIVFLFSFLFNLDVSGLKPSPILCSSSSTFTISLSSHSLPSLLPSFPSVLGYGLVSDISTFACIFQVPKVSLERILLSETIDLSLSDHELLWLSSQYLSIKRDLSLIGFDSTDDCSLSSFLIDDSLKLIVAPDFLIKSAKVEQLCQSNLIEFFPRRVCSNHPLETLFFKHLKSQEVNNLIGLPVSSVTELWIESKISNFQYILYLNYITCRKFQDQSNPPIFPFVLTYSENLNLIIDDDFFQEFSDWLRDPFNNQVPIPPDIFVENFETTRLRQIKGDTFLDQQFNQTANHVVSFLSPLESIMMTCRIQSEEILCNVVRSIIKAGDYPSSFNDILVNFPCESPINFYVSPDVFCSNNIFENLELPPFFLNLVDKFVENNPEFELPHVNILFTIYQFFLLNSNNFSLILPSWIDLVFGFKLNSRSDLNVCRVSKYSGVNLAIEGGFQVFSCKHPSKESDFHPTFDSDSFDFSSTFTHCSNQNFSSPPQSFSKFSHLSSFIVENFKTTINSKLSRDYFLKGQGISDLFMNRLSDFSLSSFNILHSSYFSPSTSLSFESYKPLSCLAIANNLLSSVHQSRHFHQSDLIDFVVSFPIFFDTIFHSLLVSVSDSELQSLSILIGKVVPFSPIFERLATRFARVLSNLTVDSIKIVDVCRSFCSEQSIIQNIVPMFFQLVDSSQSIDFDCLNCVADLFSCRLSIPNFQRFFLTPLLRRLKKSNAFQILTHFFDSCSLSFLSLTFFEISCDFVNLFRNSNSDSDDFKTNIVSLLLCALKRLSSTIIFDWISRFNNLPNPFLSVIIDSVNSNREVAKTIVFIRPLIIELSIKIKEIKSQEHHNFVLKFLAPFVRNSYVRNFYAELTSEIHQSNRHENLGIMSSFHPIMAPVVFDCQVDWSSLSVFKGKRGQNHQIFEPSTTISHLGILQNEPFCVAVGRDSLINQIRLNPGLDSFEQVVKFESRNKIKDLAIISSDLCSPFFAALYDSNIVDVFQFGNEVPLTTNLAFSSSISSICSHPFLSLFAAAGEGQVTLCDLRVKMTPNSSLILKPTLTRTQVTSLCFSDPFTLITGLSNSTLSLIDTRFSNSLFSCRVGDTPIQSICTVERQVISGDDSFVIACVLKHEKRLFLRNSDLSLLSSPACPSPSLLGCTALGSKLLPYSMSSVSCLSPIDYSVNSFDVSSPSLSVLSSYRDSNVVVGGSVDGTISFFS
ncbi:hypothetical protein RCL1_000573 [Eukaryota sp. TZLM3-RCL]